MASSHLSQRRLLSRLFSTVIAALMVVSAWASNIDVNSAAAVGPTGLTTQEIVTRILTQTTAIPAADPHDVNGDGELDTADVVENILWIAAHP